MNPKALAALHAEAFAEDQAWSAPAFADLLAAPRTRLTTHPHGFILWQSVPPEAEILTLAVSPAHQRKGIGMALLAAFAQEARAEGTETVFLEMRASNLAAGQLYAKAGFVESGQRPNYYACADGTRETAILLSKRLP